MNYLKQSTTTTIQLGPFLDETDGKTAETALTISSTDVWLSGGGAVFANPNDANAAAHDRVGWYRKQINATDTGTLGRLIVSVHEAGALPVWREFMVVPANVYDSLVAGTDSLEVDSEAAWAVQISDSVPVKGTLPTREEAVYMINQYLMERGVVGTVLTAFKVNGTTALMTFDLNSPTEPTTHHRAT